MKFSITDLFSNCDQIRRKLWPNSQETADLVTFTEEIRNGKLRFLSSESKTVMAKCVSVSYLIIFFYVSEFQDVLRKVLEVLRKPFIKIIDVLLLIVKFVKS